MEIEILGKKFEFSDWYVNINNGWVRTGLRSHAMILIKQHDSTPLFLYDLELMKIGSYYHLLYGNISHKDFESTKLNVDYFLSNDILRINKLKSFL